MPARNRDGRCRFSHIAAALAFWGSSAVLAHDSDLPRWAVERITPLHDRVSRWVDNSSRNIDGFFGTNDSLNVENDSYLRVSQELEWLEGDVLQHDIGMRFRLDVPTTSQRLRLVLESKPEEAEGTLAEQGAQRLRNDQREKRTSVLGLDRLFDKDKSKGWRNRLGGGIKLHLPPDPYARFTTERLWRLGDGPWQLSSYNRLSWFNSDGYSARSRWDIGRLLDDSRHLRYVTQFQWQEEVDTLEFSQSMELSQILGKRSAIQYAGVVVGESSSIPRVNDYYLQAAYRRNLHEEALFFDLVPELHFPRDADFQARWALTLRLEMFFRGAVRLRP
jgi:hypothetical protein